MNWTAFFIGGLAYGLISFGLHVRAHRRKCRYIRELRARAARLGIDLDGRD
jgi:hypothetical protein